MGYQERDFEIVDYRMYRHQGTGLRFRGPRPKGLSPGGYIVCIGAAQTFGCFCPEPFPALLSDSLDVPIVNYGFAGAGPRFFLQNDNLLKEINAAACVVIQVMSARSENNAVFDSGGLEYLIRKSDGLKFGARAAYQRLLLRNFLFGRKKLKEIVSETRRNWLASYTELMEKITVPIILFWFSVRSPNYTERYLTVGTLLGKFPHMVNAQVLESLKKRADAYAQCVSKRGSPQMLVSRFTGKPTTVDPSRDRQDLGGKIWTSNFYYPSPEMHIDALIQLAPICKKFVNR